jgi:hypothetical protein
MVKIAISRGGKLQGAEVNVVKRLVINAECFIRVFHKLVDGKRSIIRLGKQGLKEARLKYEHYAPQRRCRRPWDSERRSMCTSSDRDTPHGFLR